VEISRFSDAGLTIRGQGARGVVYLSDFNSNFKCSSTDSTYPCLGYGVAVYGDSAAVGPLALGTKAAVFVEDCTFRDNRHDIASNAGSRYVFRYNTVSTTDRTRNWGRIDAHGRGSYPPGSRSWEVYENQIDTEPGTNSADGIYLRGGDGVVFNNDISGAIPYTVRLTVEGGCTGKTYPVPDQPRDVYVWGNTRGGVASNLVDVPSACATFIQQGTDYALTARPGYSPFVYPHPLR